MNGKKITIQDGVLNVPDSPVIPFIEGDGTGPDIWAASVRVLDAAVEKAYNGKKKIFWKEVLAGEKAFNKTGEWLPEETLDTIREYLIAIKGPLTTPIGGGIRSLNVALRQILDLYVCLRPVKYYDGVPSPVKDPTTTGMVIYRENSEDIYAGVEYLHGTEENEKVKKAMLDIYASIDAPKIVTDLRSAELIKHASNTFLATKISFINEIGNMCKKLEVDAYEVADGMGLDNRIGRSFLDSGIGWGGSCFPKDLHALLAWAKCEKEESKIIESAVEVNNLQPLKLIELLKKHIPNLNGKTIGVLGLAFKPDTDDIRDSRSIPLVKTLLEEEVQIKVFDPKAMNHFKTLFPNIKYCNTAEDVLDADAVIIATAWDEFKQLDYTGKLIIDGRRVLEAKKTASIYEGVCW